jgi:hypothetical protein
MRFRCGWDLTRASSDPQPVDCQSGALDPEANGATPCSGTAHCGDETYSFHCEADKGRLSCDCSVGDERIARVDTDEEACTEFQERASFFEAANALCGWNLR